MSFDVFISYSHSDKPTADATCAMLEATGIRCWIAPRDIVHGTDWGESIIDAITNAKAMVLVFSGHANVSPQIKREVERAVHKAIPIIPLRIENVPMSKSLEYFLSTPHWLDALTPPLEQHLEHLAKSVKLLLRINVEKPDGVMKAAGVIPSKASIVPPLSTPIVNEKATASVIERPGPSTPVDFLNRGNTYLARNDYDWAIRDYAEAIRLNPKHAGAFYNRGCAFWSKGECDRAIQDYDEAIRLNPKFADAFVNRGLAFSKKGEYDRAIQDCDEAIRLNPKDAVVFVNRASAFEHKGEHDRAIQDYDEAIRLNPKYARAFYNRGCAFWSKGEYDRAIQDYDEAIRLNPKFALAFYGRALAKRKIGDAVGGDLDMEAAKEIDPNVGL
jgi:tetratricopeptide (TPR) repeat protein